MAPVTRSTASAGPDAVLQRVANLPVDIIATICDNADPSVLKQLRLVSKSTNSLAEPSLFRIVKLAITAQSRDRIVKISNSEKLQKQVRVLVYDNRLLPWALDYNQWKERVLTDPGYFFEDREGANFPRVEFSTSAAWRTNAAYQNYCDLLEDQKNWHRGSFEEDWLTERFRTLPNLDSL